MTHFLGKLAVASLISTITFSAQAETVKAHLADWSPYILKEGTSYGPVADYVESVLKEMGADMDVVYTNWSRAYQKVKEGSEHITFPWADREDRREDMIFSDKPVLESRLYVYYNPEFLDGEKISKHEQLQNVKVAYPRDYSEQPLLEEVGASLNIVNDYDSVIKMIQTGRAQATIGEPSIINTVIQKLNIPDGMIIRAEQPVKTNKYYVLFSRKVEGAEDLAKRFNAAQKKVGDYQ